jgi:hypothetical protein
VRKQNYFEGGRRYFAKVKFREGDGGKYTESFPMVWYFVFFCVSGFCSILYEIIWLRLAMAAFGVTSAMVSIVLSVFMAGLGVGSWVSGYLIRRYAESMQHSALSFYGLTELLIGFSAILVPVELGYGRNLLEHLGLSSSWGYYLSSGIWVALALIPWCACMGATIPLAMQAIRNRHVQKSKTSFSYLYAANVFGATLGTILPPLIIEGVGFRNTLKVGAILNGLLAATALAIAWRNPIAGAIPSTGVSAAGGQFEEKASRVALHRWSYQHGSGSRMDPAVHPILGNHGLRVRSDSWDLSHFDVCGLLLGIPTLGQHRLY